MDNRQRAALCASALAAAVFGAAMAHAGPRVARKRLDLSADFGDRGVAAFRSLGTERLDRFSAIALDGWTGSLYVAGFIPAPAVVKLDLRGTPDASFGKGGVAVLPLTGVVYGIDVWGQDGVVVCGSFDRPQKDADPATSGAARVLADGSGLDPSFGDGGRLRLGASAVEQFADRLVEVRHDPRDGSYVAAAEIDTLLSSSTGGLVRFSRDGLLDLAFGDGGFAAFGVEPSHWLVRSMAVDSAGRTVVALDEGIRRFDEAGRRETGFGVGGVLRDIDDDTVLAERIAVDDADRIVALGSTMRTRGLCLFRWTSNGLPDAEFGRFGRIDLPLRHRGAVINPRSISLVPPDPFDATSGDRVLVAGAASVGHGSAQRRYGGWFGALLDPSHPRVVRVHVHREDRPAAERLIFIGGAVALPGRAFVAGHSESLQSSAVPIESPFVVGFDVTR